MNEQAQQLITNAGEKVLEYLEAGEGFATEQAPLLAQEIVRWGVWWNVGEGLVWLIICIIASMSCIFWVKKHRRPLDDFALGKEARGVAALLSFFVAACTFFGMMSCAYSASKALIAPRLYIIEQIGRLM